MSESFDPYYKWLGIPPKYQPPHHYRLLGIELYEDDDEVIEAAAERHVTYLQDAATGEYVKQSQDLLNEIAAARLCLLNPESKEEYDGELRKKIAAEKAKSAAKKAKQSNQKKSPPPDRNKPKDESAQSKTARPATPPARPAAPQSPPVALTENPPVAAPVATAQPVATPIPTAAKVDPEPPINVPVQPARGMPVSPSVQPKQDSPKLDNIKASHEPSSSAAAAAQARRQAASGSNKVLLIAAGGTAGLVLVIVIVFAVLGSGGSDNENKDDSSAQQQKAKKQAQVAAWRPSRTSMPAAQASFPNKSLVLWLDIANNDSLEVDPNNNVRQVWDVSGNSLSTVLSSPTASPKLNNASSKQVLEFDGQGAVMQIKHTPVLDLKNGYTIITVARGNQGVLLTKGLDRNGFAVAFEKDGVAFRMATNKAPKLQANGAQSGQFAVRSVVGDNKGVTFFVDGQQAGRHNKKHIINTNRTLTIGRLPSRDKPDNFRGELGEVLIFNAALSAQDRTAVEKYLRQKWLGG